MPSLRLTVAFLALVGVWILFLPVSPTLLTPAPPADVASLAPDRAGEATPGGSGTTRTETAPPVRAIIPSPLAGGGELRRLPPATSGAATPITTEAPPQQQPAADGASEPESDGVAAEIGPTLPQPEFRRFGQPIAMDSGTIQSGRTMLRIAGVEPIAPEARCSDGTGSWPCGIRARTAFRAWLRGRSLLCPVPPESGEALTVPCLLGEEDVGQWLVANGWASAAPDSRYVEAQAEAQAARRGIWEFEIAR